MLIRYYIARKVELDRKDLKFVGSIKNYNPKVSKTNCLILVRVKCLLI